MFVRVQKVRQAGRVYEYVHIVEGYRDDTGKVRHRVVANLGRQDRLKDSGALDNLAAAFTRLDPAPGRYLAGALPLVARWMCQRREWPVRRRGQGHDREQPSYGRGEAVPPVQRLQRREGSPLSLQHAAARGGCGVARTANHLNVLRCDSTTRQPRLSR